MGEGAMLNPSNPFSEMFLVSNEGYIPLAHLDALCSLNMHLVGMHSGLSMPPDAGFMYEDFSTYLAHGNKATIPCFHIVGIKHDAVANGATLDVTISYSFYGINLKFLRRSQVFHFKSVVGDDNSQHWIFQ
jgi:hypothetical protein